MKKQYLESGKIVGTHGIKGEVRIDPWCDSPQFLAAFDKLYLDDRGETFIEVKSRPHNNITLCKIKGVDNIDDAQRLRGRIVYIDRDDVKLDEGVNFVQDLIGLAVIDADSGENYGKITDVLRTGANDVYEVTSPDGQKILVPVIDEVIPARNIDEGFVLLRPMKGLFDDED
ncbi:MAG: ribosome maturation factor RimM [Ruminococcus sp.]|nr:ribosome maturation factor RimM [Ruminococcus sp.]